MTKQEMRLKIAEVCGWTRIETHYGIPYGIEPGKENPAFKVELPNYPEDLNACAEFEDTLTTGALLEYTQRLERGALTKAPGRCEAFLRTKRLWKD